MDEQILGEFLLDKVDVKEFLGNAFKRRNFKQGDFIVTRGHLLKLCDLAIDKKITSELLSVISDNLVMSDYFTWDSDSADGEIISKTIFEWSSPEINYEINDLHLRLWRGYLQTGEYKL